MIFPVSFLLFQGCRSPNAQMAAVVPDRAFTRKLPNLEPFFEDEYAPSINTWVPGLKFTRQNTLTASMFYDEVDMNLVDTRGKPRGYIILRPTFSITEDPGGWMVATFCTLFIPSLFGMPIESVDCSCNLDLRIVDNRGEIVKSYKASATNTEYLALWWGYSVDYNRAPFYALAEVNAYKQALDKIILQLKEDIPWLCKELAKDDKVALP